MFYKFASIFFIDKPCGCQAAGMFGKRFFICLEGGDDTFERNTSAGRYEEQDLNSPMICDALEMPFHLLWCFGLIHTKHTNILEIVRMFAVVGRRGLCYSAQ